MSLSFLKIVVSVSLLLTCFISSTAFASGACCAVTKGEKNQLYIAVIGASTQSHELIDGTEYNLTQQALLVKLGYPITERLTIQGSVGLPVATKLSSPHNSPEMQESSELQGNSGVIYGVSLGYELPDIIESIEFSSAVSYSRSHGFLDKMDNGDKIDQTFLISEFQGLLIGEVDIVDKFAIYGGLRVYFGQNQLKDNKTGTKLSGEREGNAAPLVGFRYSPTKRIGLVAEGGFGHTDILSIGSVFSF